MAIALPLPGAVITQGFGENPEYYKKYGLKGHNGVDLTGPDRLSPWALHGALVYSVSYGVVQIGVSSGYGLYVYVDAGDCYWLYAHLADVLVRNGERVCPDQAIGMVGYSGGTLPGGIKGTHLHWGKRPKPLELENGYRGYVDPLEGVDWG